MRCHVCNVAVGDGQRFCHECGEKLDGVTDATQAVDVVDGDASSTGEADAAAGDAADLPEPTPRDATDASLWAAGGGAPVPEDELAPTQPVEIPASASVTDTSTLAPTEAIDATPDHGAGTATGLDSVPDADDDPVAVHEPTTTLPAGLGPAAVATDEFAPPTPADAGSTTQMGVTEPGLYDGDADAREYSTASEGFRLRASFVFAVLAAVATLLASIADVIDIRTTRPVDGIVVGIRTLDDFGSNLAVAGYIGAVLMLVGGLLACFGLRWGAGVAGGAGLSMTGWAAMTLGLVEAPIHAAEGVTLNAAGVAEFTLSVTRDLGYFLILSIGILGLVVFLVSLRMAGTGGRGGLNPWIAAVGALAAVVLAAGPLITLGGAPLDANLGIVGIPREFIAGRLVQLGLIVVTGVIGFLAVRTYGLGLALGGLGVATWLWVTSLADVGELPVGVAVGNLGDEATTPHAVTTVGVTASLALLLIAATVATVTRRRH